MDRKNDGSAQEPRCSFCQKGPDSVKRLISGPDVYICDACVELCNEIIAQEHVQESVDAGKLLSPAEIKARLDEYVIGQHTAKKILSVAVHNHYKRVFFAETLSDEVELEKSNILLVGLSLIHISEPHETRHDLV